MLLETCAVVRGFWNMIPPHLRDWSKSEILNFVQRNAPGFFQFCKNKLSMLWGKVPDSKAKALIDKTTSTFIAANNKIPPDVKKRLFEQVTGSQYNPAPNCDMQAVSEILHTDEEKKAAAMQMSYIMAILGEITQKQEIMLEQYFNSLRMGETLKKEIMDEMQETEKEFVKFAQELSRLDKEFDRTSTQTAKSKKEANDIIDLI